MALDNVAASDKVLISTNNDTYYCAMADNN